MNLQQLFAVHLVKRGDLPKPLPAELGSLPVVHAAFRALYGRAPTSDEQARVRMGLDGEWLIATMQVG